MNTHDLAGSTEDTLLFNLPSMMALHLTRSRRIGEQTAQVLALSGYPAAQMERVLMPYAVAWIRAQKATGRFSTLIFRAATEARAAGLVRFPDPPPLPGGRVRESYSVQWGPGGGRAYLAADYARKLGTFTPILQAGRQAAAIMVVIVPAFVRLAQALGLPTKGIEKPSTFDLYRWSGVL